MTQIITINVPDQTVYADGTGIRLPNLDWSRFDGDPSTPWDDVNFVEFNPETGQGYIEYREIVTHPFSRPNIKPGNKLISKADFEADYGWVLPVFFEEKARLEAEAALRAAEIEAAPARERPAQQGAGLSNEEVAALKERLAAIEAENAESKAKIDDMLKAAAKIESGGV